MAFAPNIPPIQAHICVRRGTDAIAFYRRAFGAEPTMVQMAEAASDVFWGSRYGRVRDLFGHVWAFNAPLSAA
jgi:uncharacterized glyoxalase superfamily protein PhnB